MRQKTNIIYIAVNEICFNLPLNKCDLTYKKELFKLFEYFELINKLKIEI
jgi:hypothetical protein